ncbi:TIR domain-containing protein [Nocardioides cavernae]|uniref:TIR domain-containing protein n=1 Tax=Nocardioides cavernae TaxID=1921566 RepID=A0ABR8N543_9ACTN|nr:TIR domain-containing protein [Nocardioides cavernae]MBD3923282.1 TIR domain-containing protein [Nocardioides cavernae]MBM7511796.1 DNA uptake protein ComE-like DNA-binding protein [Nocardioides cavernae]
MRGIHDGGPKPQHVNGELMSAAAEQRIFISYRRSDCQSQANGLNDGLRHRLPEARVFMDIDSIPIGADFEEHIRGEIEQCHVALILIGDNWLDARPGSDLRRIDEANDFVRLEVESSLAAKHLRVIPVLVEGATMPTPDELPESIQRLARLNAFEMSDQRWSTDIERLTQQLQQLTGAATTLAAESAPTMSFADVDDAAIRYAMSTLPDRFKTKDLSEHPAVLATHTEVSELRNYHTIIGRYLMKHRAALGLDEPGKPVDKRGSVWTKTNSRSDYAPPPPRTPSPQTSTAPPPRTSYPEPPVPAKKGRKARTMILWCVLTMGLASWAAPLWAANRRPYDKAFRKRMQVLAAILGIAALAAFVLVGSGPEDATGTPTGAASDAGGTLLLLTIAAGVAVVLIFRKPQVALAGMESVLARRDSRERYRQLVEKDRPLARSMNVGRPDVSRDYDDGGLVDVNSAPVHTLSQHGGLDHAEAARIVELRGQLGRFVSMDELLAYVDLPESTATRLRDVAVFV